MTVTVILARDAAGNDIASDVYDSASHIVTTHDKLMVKRDSGLGSPTIAEYAAGKWVNAFVGEAPKQVRPSGPAIG